MPLTNNKLLKHKYDFKNKLYYSKSCLKIYEKYYE